MLGKLRTMMAIVLAKLAKKTSQWLGKGGGNIPGVVARKIDPDILKTLSKQVEKIIIVTGTNGKTTASNLLAAILSQTGEPMIHNKEGNNLLTGVTASFITHASWTGKLKKNVRYAVFEVDESYVALVVRELTPAYVLINNFFRDQLDRVGEMDALISKMKNALIDVNTTLVLNGDDPFVMQMQTLEKRKIYFGIYKDAYQFGSFSLTETMACPHCHKELSYSHIHYGHLGYYQCSCRYSRPAPDIEATKIADDMQFEINHEEKYELSIDGVYNIYNALGPIAIAKAENISHEQIYNGLRSFKPVKGRMQTNMINGAPRLINLVKNAAGLDLSLSEALKHHEKMQLVFFLTDLVHDSQDISWIWDADLERIEQADVTRIICSGTRALDMAVRFKYAGIEEEKLIIEESIEKAIDEALKQQEKTFFFATYSALKPVQQLLEKRDERFLLKREGTRG